MSKAPEAHAPPAGLRASHGPLVLIGFADAEPKLLDFCQPWYD
ncbi:MAG: hypothetical protein AAF773_25755 [Cyanobacteria bacterium P01_D01_bin.115]